MHTHSLALELVQKLHIHRLKFTAAESCTGGLIASAVTAIPGSSSVFDFGFITYSNEAKTQMIGVPSHLFEQVGAVSEEVARAMAEGALKTAHAHVAVSVTGIAGPGGGTAEKPVGTVWFGRAFRLSDGSIDTHTQRVNFGEIGRGAVREASAEFALNWALEYVRTL